MAKADDKQTPEELSEEELEAVDGDPLPDREAMSVIRGVEPLPQPIVPEPPIDWE